MISYNKLESEDNMMTKKHFKEIAKLIKSNGKLTGDVSGRVMHTIPTGRFTNQLCLFFKNDNPNFDEIRFREAAGEILGK